MNVLMESGRQLRTRVDGSAEPAVRHLEELELEFSSDFKIPLVRLKGVLTLGTSRDLASRVLASAPSAPARGLAIDLSSVSRLAGPALMELPKLRGWLDDSARFFLIGCSEAVGVWMRTRGFRESFVCMSAATFYRDYRSVDPSSPHIITLN